MNDCMVFMIKTDSVEKIVIEIVEQYQYMIFLWPFLDMDIFVSVSFFIIIVVLDY